MTKKISKKSQDNQIQSGNRYISKMSLPPSEGQQPRYGVWDTKMKVFIAGCYSYSEEVVIESAKELSESGYSEQ